MQKLKSSLILYKPAVLAACLVMATAASAAVQSVVLISGLNEPRDVAVAPNGDIHVVEAGAAIDTTGLTPITTDTGTAYFGTTGSVSVWSNGAVTRPITGLPMLYNPTRNEITGGQGITVTTSGTVLAIGLGGTAANRDLGPAGASALGNLMTLPFTRTDLSAFVGSASNPFHMAVSGDLTVVADAGDNSVLTIQNGVVSRAGYLPDTPGGADFVPTGVAFGAGGNIFVGGLSGFPFTPGAASVYRMAQGQASLFATGFTNITDIALGQDGTLFVLEYATNGILSGNNTGGLWALSADGSSRQLLMTDGLVHPTGLTTGTDGTLYITNSGAALGQGQLLAVTVPEPGATVLMGLLGVVGLMRRRRCP
ncbi:MAG: vgb 2 [Verrucomicrobiales bacterium]|nr:vgb 2 [Verrucomicrobiales bacterium]